MAQAGQKRKAGDAAGPSNANGAAGDVDGALEAAAECPVCLGIFDDPRILPACGHTLCLECAKKLIDAAKKLACPCCRKISDLAPNDEERANGMEVRDLMKNFGLTSLAEQLRKRQESVLCGNCKNKQATITCDTCEEHFCGNCCARAHEMPVFAWHVRRPYRPAANASRRSFCTDHPTQPLLYCTEKAIATCLQCMHMAPAEHAGHAHVSIAEGAATLGAALTAAIEIGKAKLRALEQREKRYEDSIRQIQVAAKVATDASDSKYKELRGSLDAHYNGWKSKIQSQAQADEAVVNRQLTTVRAAARQLRDAIDCGGKLGGSLQIQLVRLQPNALARIEAAIGVAAVEAIEPRPIKFDGGAVQIAESGVGPVKVGDKVVVSLDWDVAKEQIDSKSFLCCGLPWDLQVYPKGFGAGKGTDVSIFLGSAIMNVPENFALKTAFDVKCGRHDFSDSYTFNAAELEREVAYGKLKFAPIAGFENENVKNGKLQVEVTVYEAVFVPA